MHGTCSRPPEASNGSPIMARQMSLRSPEDQVDRRIDRVCWLIDANGAPPRAAVTSSVTTGMRPREKNDLHSILTVTTISKEHLKGCDCHGHDGGKWRPAVVGADRGGDEHALRRAGPHGAEPGPADDRQRAARVNQRPAVVQRLLQPGTGGGGAARRPAR